MTYRRRKRRRRVTPQAAVSWLWEFSKKVVWTVTLLYIVSFVFAMVLCWRELQFIGNTAAITTLITESNETFRVVVGGYLIKAGIENACKIVTSKQTPQEETDDNAEGEGGNMGFIMENIRVIGIVYLIGAIITFIGLFAFFMWAAKADAKEQELYPEYPIEDENEPFSLYITVVFIISIMTAIIWWGVPLLLGGLLLYDKITQEYPQLMGGMNDTEEKENGKE